MLTVVLGGPGCGKTTALLDVIDKLLSQGVSPAKIAYLTFTKKAAEEGLTRAMAKFGFEEEDLPYFRTIHSLAFQQLALDPNMVMTKTNWEEFGQIVGMSLTHPPEGERGGRPGENFLSMVMLARLQKEPLESICQDAQVNSREAEYIAANLRTFKRDRNLFDFTDMLEAFQTEGVVPPVDYLIVDEGQDLSRLQWAVVERIADRVKDMWVAGDDDQAIYEWAGADVPYFLKLKGKKVVLPTSYRLKSNIFDITQRVVDRIQHRYDKDWKPHEDGGLVDTVTKLRHVDLSTGSWYLLARNRYLLAPLREHLRLSGYPYLENGASSTDNPHVRCMIYWESLRKGETISGEQAKLIFSHLRRNLVASNTPAIDDDATLSLGHLRESFGLHTDEPWYNALSLAPLEIEYYRACRQRGERLLAEPRITLATIHAVKGGEADNVFLLTDMAPACYKSMVRKKSDEETRVFYVATSRAKEKLIICQPITPRYYDLAA